MSDFLQHQSEQLKFDQTLADCSSDKDLDLIIKDGSSEFPLSALWLLLMSRLKDITTDGRLEVRHSIGSQCSESGHADSSRCFAYAIQDLQ